MYVYGIYRSFCGARLSPPCRDETDSISKVYGLLAGYKHTHTHRERMGSKKTDNMSLFGDNPFRDEDDPATQPLQQQTKPPSHGTNSAFGDDHVSSNDGQTSSAPESSEQGGTSNRGCTRELVSYICGCLKGCVRAAGLRRWATAAVTCLTAVCH